MERTDDDLLTPADFATYLGVTTRRLRQKVAARLVPRPIRLAGSPRWKWKTIRQWTEALDILRQLGVQVEQPDRKRKKGTS